MPPTHTDEGCARPARFVRATPPRRSSSFRNTSSHVRAATRRREARKVGYLMKERVGRIEQLLDAVQRVAAGECVVDRAVVDELLERRRREDPIAELTPREREILGLMAEGRSNQGIGRAPGSARRRSRRTSAARSRSSGSRKRRRTIAACSPCSRTFGNSLGRGLASELAQALLLGGRGAGSRAEGTCGGVGRSNVRPRSCDRPLHLSDPRRFQRRQRLTPQ